MIGYGGQASPSAPRNDEKGVIASPDLSAEANHR
jgi:hypothetical protein